MIVPYQTNTVRNTDLPSGGFNARASADSFGGGQAESVGLIGQSAQHLGNTVEDIALAEQNKVNQDIARKNVNDARLELSQFANTEYAKNGSDAFGASQRIQEYSTKIAEKYSGSMQTRAQQDIFNQVFEHYSSEHAERAMRHEQSQKEVFRNQTMDQENQIHADDIAANINDRKLVENRLHYISENVKQMNSGRGDQAKLVEGVVQGVIMKTVAETALNDPVAALTFLESHKDKFKGSEGADRARRLRDSLQTKIFDIKKAELVYNVVDASPTEEEALKRVDESNQSPDKKLEMKKDVHAQFLIKHEAMNTAERQAKESQWNDFWKKPSLEAIANSNADETTKHQMREALEKSTKKLTNEEYENNYGKILRMTGPEFANLNIDSIRYDIEPDKIEDLRIRQAKLRKEGKEHTPNLTKALEDAKGEAGRMSAFQPSAKDNDVVAAEKDRRLNQYLNDYEALLRGYPEEKRNDPNIRESIRKQLLKEKVIPNWILPEKYFPPAKSPNFEYKPLSDQQTSQAPNAADPAPAPVLSPEMKAAIMVKQAYKSGKISKAEYEDKLAALGFQN